MAERDHSVELAAAVAGLFFIVMLGMGGPSWTVLLAALVGSFVWLFLAGTARFAAGQALRRTPEVVAVLGRLPAIGGDGHREPT